MPRKPQRSDQDFSDEIQSHIQIEADRLMADGMDRDAAFAAARRAFGNLTKSQERFHESIHWMWLEHLQKYVLYSFRQMRNSPIATVAIILSLGLGIGATTAIFSLADQALVRALRLKILPTSFRLNGTAGLWEMPWPTWVSAV